MLFRSGVDVSNVVGAGAAGGLAGGLVALGARLVPGFEMVADEMNLHDRLRAADLVITGEGRLDDTSFDGKVIGGLTELCHAEGKPIAAIVGTLDIDDESIAAPSPIKVIGDLYGVERAMREPLWCIEHAALDLLSDVNPN